MSEERWHKACDAADTKSKCLSLGFDEEDGNQCRWNDGEDAQLFDLSQDPSESMNLAKANPGIVSDLKRRVVAWHATMPADNGATYREPPRKKPKPRPKKDG